MDDSRPLTGGPSSSEGPTEATRSYLDAKISLGRYPALLSHS